MIQNYYSISSVERTSYPAHCKFLKTYSNILRTIIWEQYIIYNNDVSNYKKYHNNMAMHLSLQTLSQYRKKNLKSTFQKNVQK